MLNDVTYPPTDINEIPTISIQTVSDILYPLYESSELILKNTTTIVTIVVS